MANEIRRLDGPRRARPVRRTDDAPVYMGSSPLVDGTLPDEYIGGRHRSEYVDYPDNQHDHGFRLERDLQDLKSSIVSACESLVSELISNKLSTRRRIDL